MDFVEIERTGKRILERFPNIKKTAKRIYQLTNYALSKNKVISSGNLHKISPNDEYEYFYGYYDKSPWDIDDRFVIALRAKQTYKTPAPKETAEIVLIDTENTNTITKIATTRAWNVQQGCMAQWMGPDYRDRIIYNDFRNGKYCSVIYNVNQMREEKELPMPIYDISHNGKFALSLDFSRLHRLRPGYGYSNLPDTTKDDLCPDKPCIWKVDIETGRVSELFKYTDFASFESNNEMVGAEHKVNHIMISPNDERFMVLHRWIKKGRKYTRLVTVNIDGTDMYNLSDNVFVSHCFWKNNSEILSFLRKNNDGEHYYLMTDKTQEYKLFWEELNTDGHCSYSPNRKYIITDTYPNRNRIASIYLCTEDVGCKKIAYLFSPFRYDNECRCDLHPRWNRKGNSICIDSVHEGKRALYILNVEDDILALKKTKHDMVLVKSNRFKLLEKKHSNKYYVEDMFCELNKLKALFKDLCLHYNIKINESYYNPKLKNLSANTIIVFDPHVRIQFLNWLVENNPNKRIILWFWNTIEEIGNHIPLDEIPKRIEKWSYSIHDCIKYGFNYNTTFYPYNINSNIENNKIKYDVCFIGKDKGRLDKLLKIKEDLNNINAKVFFHISPTHQYELYKNHIYEKKIPYEKVDQIISESKCILDCQVNNFAGPTIRPLEALFKKKKLITDNTYIKNEDYYSKDNVFVYGEDSIDKLNTFISTPYVDENNNIAEKYTINAWLERFN